VHNALLSWTSAGNNQRIPEIDDRVVTALSQFCVLFVTEKKDMEYQYLWELSEVLKHFAQRCKMCVVNGRIEERPWFGLG